MICELLNDFMFLTFIAAQPNTQMETHERSWTLILDRVDEVWRSWGEANLG
jgi:hypothetical protein